ncbi:MAG: alpha/beta hydrolase [Fibrobacter sp.]|nr:alpha/beta hydrolase [Fibrobacter sp.]
MIQEVQFYSEGSRISALLYLPDSSTTPVPGIVLCHGFAGVKELLLPNFADYFSKNGYAVLSFDYRGFGGSEGEAGRIVPDYQIRDIRNAITFLQSRAEVNPDRIGLWGTSFGGANAIVAASIDNRIKCLCVQLTFSDGEQVIAGNWSPDEKNKFLDTLQKMKQKRVCTGKEMMVPIHKVLTDEQSRAFFERYVGNFPALQIKLPFLTVAETMEHKPIIALKNLKIPIHIVGAEKDSVNPPQESLRLYETASGPKKLHMVNATHYEVYEGTLFFLVAEQQLIWFKEYL